MRLILINTCGAEASVALADTEQHESVIGVSTMPGRMASESLVAEMRKILAESRWQPADLDGIVVVTGPGSFTGVRTGSGAAKGLAEAISKPILSLSRLALLADAAGPGYRQVCALLDAGRGEFYCGQYGKEDAAQESLVSKKDAVSAALLADVTMVCEQAVFDALSSLVALTMVREPGAANALPLAMQSMAAGGFDDPATLDAIYLRRTDAEIFSAPSKRAEQGGG